MLIVLVYNGLKRWLQWYTLKLRVDAMTEETIREEVLEGRKRVQGARRSKSKVVLMPTVSLDSVDNNTLLHIVREP